MLKPSREINSLWEERGISSLFRILFFSTIRTFTEVGAKLELSNSIGLKFIEWQSPWLKILRIMLISIVNLQKQKSLFGWFANHIVEQFSYH